MKIDDKVIKQIEKALGFNLYENQIKVIKDNDWSGFIPGLRRQGETTAHMIRLVLSEGKLNINNFRQYTDRNPNETHYNYWYRDEFMELRDKLRGHGLKVIEVVNLANKPL